MCTLIFTNCNSYYLDVIIKTYKTGVFFNFSTLKVLKVLQFYSETLYKTRKL